MAHQAVAPFGEKGDDPYEHAAVLMDLGEILWLVSRRTEAIKAATEAALIYERKGIVVSEARAKRVLDEMRVDSPSAAMDVE